MKDRSGMKTRERKILEFLQKEITMKGYPPTVREICQAIGINVQNLMR